MKALDALNQELFQLGDGKQGRPSLIGVFAYRDMSKFWLLPFLTASLLTVAELKQDCFYGRLPQQHKAMMAYLKASLHGKTYSSYLWAAKEAEKEDSMELSQSPQNQVIDNTAKPKTTSFFPLHKLKGNQPVPKMAAMCLAY